MQQLQVQNPQERAQSVRIKMDEVRQIEGDARIQPEHLTKKKNVFQLIVIIYHCERSAQMPAAWGSSKWKCENKERIVMFDICGPNL